MAISRNKVGYSSSLIHGFLYSIEESGNTSYAMLSRGIPWNIPRVTCTSSVCTRENTSDTRDIPWYTTRERCITILYHAIENTVAITIKAIYARRMVGRIYNGVPAF